MSKALRDLLVRTEPLSPREIDELEVALRVLLTPHLNRLPMGRLSDRDLLKGGSSGSHSLRADSPVGLPMADVDGYYYLVRSEEPIEGASLLNGWGLGRSGLFHHFWIDLTVEPYSNPDTTCQWYERAYTVTITEVSLSQLQSIGVMPAKVVHALVGNIRAWSGNLQARAAEAANVCYEVTELSDMLQRIP